MSKKILIILICISINLQLFSQSFKGDGIAVHKDSSIIVGWATAAFVERGYINISDTNKTFTERGITSNRAFAGSVENALGKADSKTISLGDGGEIILTFDKPIINGIGPDFAVFENALFVPPNQIEKAFVELAFVEVSSDGINYERFPAISNLQYERQIEGFEAVDWKLFKNLAGVYPTNYGYPFDLDDIPGIVVDKMNITHVKIIDVVGNISPEYARYDSQGNIINDPWPTLFATGGFDLDAIAVINQKQDFADERYNNISIFPNPAKDVLNITSYETIKEIKIFNISGNIVFSQTNNNNQKKVSINVNNLVAGIYILVINNCFYRQLFIL